jgi:sugar phosphate permease
MPGLRYRGWWVMLGCIACQVDLGFAKDGMDVFMTDIVREMGWGRADFQVAGWVLLATYGLLTPATGYVLDRLGPRVVLTAGVLGVSLAYAAYGVMTGFGQYLGVTPLLAVGLVALGDIPASTVAARWFERHRGAVLGIVLVGSNLGAMVVNLLAKALYRGFGDWRPAVLALALVMLAVALPFSLGVVRNPRPGEIPREERDPDAGAGDGRGRDGSLRLRDAARTRSFWLLAAALFAYYFYYLFVNRHVIALLRDRGSFGYTVPAPLVGLGVAPEDFPEFTKSMFEVVGLPGKLAIGWLVDRWRVSHALAWNFLVLTLACSLLPFIGDRASLMGLFIVLNGLGWGAQQVLTPLTIAACFGIRHMGTIFGTVLLVLLPAQLGPWYAGYVFDRTGTYESFLPLCAAFLGLAALGLFAVRPHAGRERA